MKNIDWLVISTAILVITFRLLFTLNDQVPEIGLGGGFGETGTLIGATTLPAAALLELTIFIIDSGAGSRRFTGAGSSFAAP